MNIDWQRVVLNIRRAGLSCAQQDRRIGRRGGYTQRIANGEVKRVWFEEGVVLLDLHHDLCPERHHREALSADTITRLFIAPAALSKAA